MPAKATWKQQEAATINKARLLGLEAQNEQVLQAVRPLIAQPHDK